MLRVSVLLKLIERFGVNGPPRDCRAPSVEPTRACDCYTAPPPSRADVEHACRELERRGYNRMAESMREYLDGEEHCGHIR